jgi:hypothetical protein
MLVCVCGFARAEAASGQQAVLPPEHHWTDIGTSGQAEVDWKTLDRQATSSGRPIFLIWARTHERSGPVEVRTAVNCAPRHAAVVETRRRRDDGSIDVAGPVALNALVWQDPPPKSYLADVELAVCARTEETQARPC